MDTGPGSGGAAEIIQLDEGETAVVGFGLLLARGTLDKTLGRRYDGPFRRCHVDGWRRSWDVGMPNTAFYYVDECGDCVYPEQIVYLNVRRAPGALMNCTLFVLNADELEVLNGREWIYEGVDVTADVRGLEVRGGPALMNVGRPEHALVPTDRGTAAIRGSYIAMFDRVLGELGPDIEQDYRSTTDPVPEHLIVDDVLDPDRPNPWKAAGHDFDPGTQQSPD